MRNLEEFNQSYKNKTAFVIGAGCSIHLQDLSPLSDFLTITVNSGFLAFPKADFFITDDWSTACWSYFFKDLKEADTTVLLYKNMLKDKASMFGDRAVLFKHRKGYHITDTYSHSNYDMHIMQSRSSVGSAIHVAHIMGCSKIVLIGIDGRRIDNFRYFWQMDRNKYKVYRNDTVPVDKYRRTKHAGISTDNDLMDMQNYWQRFGSKLSGKCSILNASPISLITAFPKVELKDIINEAT